MLVFLVISRMVLTPKVSRAVKRSFAIFAHATQIVLDHAANNTGRGLILRVVQAYTTFCKYYECLSKTLQP